MYNCTFLSLDIRYYKEQMPFPPILLFITPYANTSIPFHKKSALRWTGSDIPASVLQMLMTEIYTTSVKECAACFAIAY